MCTRSKIFGIKTHFEYIILSRFCMGFSSFIIISYYVEAVLEGTNAKRTVYYCASTGRSEYHDTADGLGNVHNAKFRSPCTRIYA